MRTRTARIFLIASHDVMLRNVGSGVGHQARDDTVWRYSVYILTTNNIGSLKDTSRLLWPLAPTGKLASSTT